MTPGSGTSVIPVAVFLAILLIVLPVSADNVTTSQTTVATIQTTVPTSQASPAATQTTIPTTQPTVATTIAPVTPTNTTVAVTLPATVVTTVNPTIPGVVTETTGSVMVYSSPTGASILIDDVYSGTTPKTLYGVPAGNHILRLVLEGYYDYEGSIYIVPGQPAQGYGTLQPMSRVMSAAPTLALPAATIPVIVPVVTTAPGPTQDAGLLANTSVLVAIIGAITVLIAVAASIYTHLTPPRKE
jgi:hypothetical protein